MDRKEKFENFLDSFKGKSHDALIESIKKGFQIWFENVSPETDEILDIMNQYGISWEEAKKEHAKLKTTLTEKRPPNSQIEEILNKYQFKNEIENLQKEIHDSQYFKPSGTFSAISAAEKFAKDKGYSVGSMEHDYPIAIAKGEGRYISKWNKLGEDAEKIDGVIIPVPEFREGGALIIFFKENVLEKE